MTSFTEELEALLEATAYSLRTGQELKYSLEDCDTDSFFDVEFLSDLSCLSFSRSELLELVIEITEQLQIIEGGANSAEHHLKNGETIRTAGSIDSIQELSSVLQQLISQGLIKQADTQVNSEQQDGEVK